MDYSNKIVSNPEIMLGKPIIKGTRITVASILRKIAERIIIDELMEGYPQLKKADVLAALSYSADVIAEEEFVVP